MKPLDSIEIKLCQLQAKIFEASVKNTTYSSPIFIRRFMLSNILFHKGHKNEILEDFINRGNYYVAHLDIQMYNKNFCNTDVEQATDTDEVIVTNYDITKMLPKKPRNLW